MNFVDIHLEPIQSDTKKKILETAIDFFSRKGYTGVSVRDITREVGIKESSLYKHFKNKDEILETIFLNFRIDSAIILPPVERIDAILEAIGPEEFLNTGLKNFMKHAEDPNMRSIWRIMYIEQFRDPLAKEIYSHDIVRKTVDFLALAFGRMIARQQIRPFDPMTLAVEYQYPLFTMIMEYIMVKSDGMDSSDVERKMSEHVRFFWSAVKP